MRQKEIFYEKAVVSLIICGVLFIGLLSIQQGQLLRIIAISLLVVLLALNYLMRTRLNPITTYRLFAILVTIMLVILEWFGNHLTDYFWIIFFPITYYTLFGREEGLVWSIVCIILLSITIMVREWVMLARIELIDTISIFTVYILILSVMHQIDKDRDTVSDRILELEKQLEEARSGEKPE